MLFSGVIPEHWPTPQHTLPCLEPCALNPENTQGSRISRTSTSPFTVPFGSGRPGPSARVTHRLSVFAVAMPV